MKKPQFQPKQPPIDARRAWSTVYVPAETFAALRAFCAEKGVTQSSAVRVAIAEMIEKHGAASEAES